MSMIDDVRSQMMEAMKNKNKDRKDALSMLLSALKNKAIDKREDLTQAEEYEVVKKEIIGRILKKPARSGLPFIRNLHQRK